MRKFTLLCASLVLSIITGAQTINYSYTGSIQTYVVPPCITAITITAAGGAGGPGNNPSIKSGGFGAVVTATVTVVPGHTLDIVVGDAGTGFGWGGGGGGGTFVWDATSGTYPLIAAGGGGGNGASATPLGLGQNGSTTTSANGGPPYNGAGGLLGQAGAAGTGTSYGGAGAGWNTSVGVPSIITSNFGQGGTGEPTSFVGGAGGTLQPGGDGGYGGGGGGGCETSIVLCGGGGGGGGYNGGGGGNSTTTLNNEYGGAGGGSGYYSGGSPYNNAANFLSPVTVSQTNTSFGYAIITAPTGVIVNISSSHNCTQGTASVSPTGGATPYTYVWAPGGQTTVSITGLSSGTYSVTVTDHNGCAMTASTTIAIPPPLNANAVVNTNSGECTNTGSATSSPTGGTPNYTYSWTNGSTVANVTGLSKGSYTVTVTDASGCTNSANIVITAPPPITVNAVVNTNAGECTNTGSATANAGAGVPAYTYAWTGGNTNANATGLSQGTYIVTVTDASGCTATATVDITAPPPLVVNTVINNNATACNNSGSATVNASSGLPNYTYLWNTGSTNVTLTGLSVGTYTVTVKDANGCQATATATITVPPPLVANASVNNNTETCINNGSAIGNGSGGTPAYTYSWAPGGQTTTTITGLSAGTYTLTVKDAAGCNATTSITIGTLLAVVVNTTVNANTTECTSVGRATASTSGGITPYTYLWSPGGQTTAHITGLSAGTYTVTVKDADGCTATATAVITAPPPLTANAVVNTNSSECIYNGSATASPTGGTLAYTYLWTNGSTTNNASGLSAGTYNVTITDANGCTATASVVITAPPPLVGGDTVNSNTTACTTVGSATIKPTGGLPAYTYLWGNGNTNATQTGLSAGSYNVTVTDANGCNIAVSVTITQPPPLTAGTTINSNAGTCGNTGSATANPAGGATPYTYSWATGGQTTAHITGLSAGTYTLTVTDAQGCTATATATIILLPPVTANATVTTNATACNSTAGSANVAAGGGAPPYTYLWTPGGQTTPSITGLSAGTYSVLVTDANGCTATSSVIITIPPPLNANAVVNTNSAECIYNGSATATPTGGNPAYTYLWTNGNTSSHATGLSGGTYGVTVTDADGCTATASITITAPPPLVGGDIINSNTTECTSVGSATITPSGGSPAYTYLWGNGNTNATQTGLSAGSYNVTVTDANNCNVTVSFSITAPPVLTAGTTINRNAETCGNIGSATANPGGGLAAYTYSWAPGGQTTATITGLSASTYTVTITDANLCTASATATIILLPPVTANAVIITNATACNANAGSAKVIPGGGAPGYTYLWTGGQTNDTATGLSAGSYTVTVTDLGGCTATASVLITVPSPLTANAVVNSNSLECINTGSATVTPGGGNTPYTYLWTGGNTNANATGLGAGSYTATVTDADGCTATASVVITAPTPLTAGAIINSNTTECTSLGSATMNPSGGLPAYTYLWGDGGTNISETGLSAGTYNTTVTDANNCSVTVNFSITAPAALTVNGIVNTNCGTCGNTGSATANTSGGVTAYTYLWSGGQSTAFISGLSAGTYSVSVTDNVGCNTTASVTILQLTAVTADTVINSYSSACANTGNVSVVPGGGEPPYNYLWTNSSTNLTVTGLSVGSYTVTVTDLDGCTATSSVNITAPPAVTANAIVNANTGECTSVGSATVTPGGGNLPYTFLWTGGNTNAHATGLSAGGYTVTVTDADLCSATASVTITSPSVITVNPSVTSNSAACASTGSASVVAGSGQSPYTYLWTGGNTTTAITGLSAGTYIITVSDGNGCSVSASVSITAPATVIPNVVINNNASSCASNGSATASPTGGALPYTYLWTGGNTNANASGLSAGNYTVTVTDANGCAGSASINITQPSPLTGDLGVQQSTCGLSNGSLFTIVSGGFGAYTYDWSPGGSTSATLTGLSAGTYSVLITDAQGCSVNVLAALTNKYNINFNVCCDTTVSSGQPVNLEVTPATKGNTYIWTPPTDLSCTNCPDPTATASVTTIYSVLVTDTNGCSARDTVTVTIGIPCTDFQVPTVFTPNDDGINDDFTINSVSTVSFSITIFDRWGKEVFTSTDASVSWNGRNKKTNNLVPDGTYYYIINANCGTTDYSKKGFVEVLGEK